MDCPGNFHVGGKLRTSFSPDILKYSNMSLDVFFLREFIWRATISRHLSQIMDLSIVTAGSAPEHCHSWIHFWSLLLLDPLQSIVTPGSAPEHCYSWIRSWALLLLDPLQSIVTPGSAPEHCYSWIRSWALLLLDPLLSIVTPGSTPDHCYCWIRSRALLLRDPLPHFRKLPIVYTPMSPSLV